MASCIHPKKVKVYNEIYGTSKAEIVRARKIANAYDAALATGQGATTVDAVMIDVPIAGRSRALRAFSDALAMLPAKLWNRHTSPRLLRNIDDPTVCLS